MKMFFRAALTLGAMFVAVPAMAQTGPGVDVQLRALVAATNSLLTAANTLNASFAKATLLVAGTDYTSSAFRAVNVTCTSTGSANLTLLGTGSAVLPYTFTSGPSYQIAFQLKSIDAVPSGCVLEGLN